MEIDDKKYTLSKEDALIILRLRKLTQNDRNVYALASKMELAVPTVYNRVRVLAYAGYLRKNKSHTGESFYEPTEEGFAEAIHRLNYFEDADKYERDGDRDTGNSNDQVNTWLQKKDSLFTRTLSFRL